MVNEKAIFVLNKSDLGVENLNPNLKKLNPILISLKNEKNIEEFITAEESGASFPKTSIRVKPNQTPITEDSNILERIKDTQKEITDIYQELSYEDLTNVLNEWLNPDEESTETSTEEPKKSVNEFDQKLAEDKAKKVISGDVPVTLEIGRAHV